MVTPFPPISRKVPRLLHGADYNPDQWLKYPDVLKEDIRLMKLSRCNVMSVGIFSWVSLEPEEGRFTFDWLDQVLDSFEENGIYSFLATPSGARPAWMSKKYPEVLRTERNRVRNLHGKRHNHCYTSPVYRQKTAIMNGKLAERYAHHPAVIGWHISNEYSGECHCDLCQAKFREWLLAKYKTLDQLNHAWWTAFWSHTYTDWDEIESPAPHGEDAVHGLNLDWKRFVTDQTVDFCRHEIAHVRSFHPELPVTTNFMGTYAGLNYWKFADLLDVISWDSYPAWHNNRQKESELGADIAFVHDINRSLKGGRPFMLMESTPSMTNWQDVSKLKRPGMHELSSLQAIAHGSDTVQYFQWRKSRGSSEKLHGAVVDHEGSEHTRVFQDVKKLGEKLAKLDEIAGTTVEPEVAVIFDWENHWALEDAQGPRNISHYERTVKSFYQPFWEEGVPVDVIHMDGDFSQYKLVIAPMLYMLKKDTAKRIERFVQDGGTFVATYWSGIVDEHDLAFLGGFPGGLRKTLGIWSEEIDALYDGQKNTVVMDSDNRLGLSGSYEASELCDLVHLEGAEALAFYDKDFYAGRPALTVNLFGAGKAYYIASRNEASFQKAFISKLIEETGIAKVLDTDLPDGVTAQLRTDGKHDYVFLLNFTEENRSVALPDETYTDMLKGTRKKGTVKLPPYGTVIFRRSRQAE